jgi:hypothetical protein
MTSSEQGEFQILKPGRHAGLLGDQSVILHGGEHSIPMIGNTDLVPEQAPRPSAPMTVQSQPKRPQPFWFVGVTWQV